MHAVERSSRGPRAFSDRRRTMSCIARRRGRQAAPPPGRTANAMALTRDAATIKTLRVKHTGIPRGSHAGAASKERCCNVQVSPHDVSDAGSLGKRARSAGGPPRAFRTLPRTKPSSPFSGLSSRMRSRNTGRILKDLLAGPSSSVSRARACCCRSSLSERSSGLLVFSGSGARGHPSRTAPRSHI